MPRCKGIRMHPSLNELKGFFPLFVSSGRSLQTFTIRDVLSLGKQVRWFHSSPLTEWADKHFWN